MPSKQWRTGVDKRCRRCGEVLETIPYVLNHCGVHAARQLLHNAVQDRLVKAAARCPGHININNTVEGVHGQDTVLRPDIVVRDDVNRYITIVDVCVPFENRIAAIDAARQDKIAKYQPLADQLSGKGYRVTVEAFAIGSLAA